MERIVDGLLRTRGADVDLAFRIQGSGPAVVLLHGTSANHAVWAPIQEALSRRATVIALDQRGHGYSDKPSSGYTGREFAADVFTVLDSLGIGEAVVAGHSLGARNAWLAGAWEPGRISRVVAVDYTPFVETAVLDELAARVASGNRTFADAAAIEDYLRARYPRMLPEAISRRATWGYARLTSGPSKGHWRPLAEPDALQQLIAGLRTPWEEEFRTARPGMTHIRGIDSRIVSPQAWEAARAARPADRWVVARQADHYVPEETPDLIIEEIDHALRS